jgi:hypothetical protein
MLRDVLSFGLTRRALLSGGATVGIAGLGAPIMAQVQNPRTIRVGGSRRIHIDGTLRHVPGSGGSAAQLNISVTVDGPEDAMSGSGWVMGPPPPLPAVPVAPIFFTQAGSVNRSVVTLRGRGLFSSIVGCVGAEIEVTADGADGFVTFSCMCIDPALPQWKYDGFSTVVHD